VVIYVEFGAFLTEKTENVFLPYVDERQQLPECTCFAALPVTAQQVNNSEDC